MGDHLQAHDFDIQPTNHANSAWPPLTELNAVNTADVHGHRLGRDGVFYNDSVVPVTSRALLTCFCVIVCFSTFLF